MINWDEIDRYEHINDMLSKMPNIHPCKFCGGILHPILHDIYVARLTGSLLMYECGCCGHTIPLVLFPWKIECCIDSILNQLKEDSMSFDDLDDVERAAAEQARGDELDFSEEPRIR